jgi:hypothetical protein
MFRLTAKPIAEHYLPHNLRNGHPMFQTHDHSPAQPGFFAQVCACVVVAKKSKKQSLI